MDEHFWFKGSGASPTCRSIAAHAKLVVETDQRCPIILSADGRFVDGMHQVCKAWIMVAESVKAVRYSVDPEPDYVDDPENELPYD